MRFNLILFAFFFVSIWSSTAQSSWTIFRGNQQLSGMTSANLPEKPKLLCSFQTGDDIKASPVVDDQTIYCGSTDGSMYAVGFDGKQKWKFVSGNAIEAPALLLDGSVVFGTLDGMFFKLNAKTGKQIWKYKSDNQIEGSANWLKVGKQIRLVVGSYDITCIVLVLQKVTASGVTNRTITSTVHRLYMENMLFLEVVTDMSIW